MTADHKDAVKPKSPARNKLVFQWDRAYCDVVGAMFEATHSNDTGTVSRLAGAYRTLAHAWRDLAAEPDTPMWVQHAVAVAAEEFDRRGRAEQSRLVSNTSPRPKRGY